MGGKLFNLSGWPARLVVGKRIDLHVHKKSLTYMLKEVGNRSNGRPFTVITNYGANIYLALLASTELIQRHSFCHSRSYFLMKILTLVGTKKSS